MGDYSKTSGSLLIRDLNIWRFGDEGKACEGRPFHKWDVLDVFRVTAKGCKPDAPRVCRLGTITGGIIWARFETSDGPGLDGTSVGCLVEWNLCWVPGLSGTSVGCLD